MPRRPPNVIIDFYRGPHFGPLITPWLTQEGRLVLLNYKEVRPYPWDSLIGYVSTAVDSFNGPSIASRSYTPGFDFSVGDVIAIPAGTTPSLTVIQIDHLTPFDGDDYARLWIVSYPFPP